MSFENDKPIGFRNWRPNEPEKEGVEDYVIIWLGGKFYGNDQSGQWQDKPDNQHNRNGFICIRN